MVSRVKRIERSEGPRIKKDQAGLTHEVLVVIVIGVVNNAVAVLLVEPAESAGPVVLRVDGAPALEARLPETLVEAFAQTPAGDLRVEFAA
jgi:hypothetical protein